MTLPRFDQHAKFAFVIACALLVLCSVAFKGAVYALNVYLQKQPVELRGSFSTIARTLGRWKAVGEDGTMKAEIVEAMGTDKYLERIYALEGEQPSPALRLHLAYYTGMIDTVPHVPDRCFVAGGMNIKSQPANLSLRVDRIADGWESDPQYSNLVSNEPYQVVKFKNDFLGEISVRMPVGELKMRTTEFEQPSRPRLRIFGGYFFIANGRLTPSPEGVRIMAFNLSEKYAYYCKVQFTYGAEDATQEKFISLVSEILKDLLPELMQRLPDWAEVERRTPVAASASAVGSPLSALHRAPKINLSTFQFSMSS